MLTDDGFRGGNGSGVCDQRIHDFDVYTLHINTILYALGMCVYQNQLILNSTWYTSPEYVTLL